MKETLSNKLIDNISTTSTSSNNHSSNTSINSINSSISLDNGKYTTLNKIVRNRTSSNNQINQKAESDEDSVDNTHKYRVCFDIIIIKLKLNLNHTIFLSLISCQIHHQAVTARIIYKLKVTMVNFILLMETPILCCDIIINF